jgi:Domain of unknown function (DUF5666)
VNRLNRLFLVLTIASLLGVGAYAQEPPSGTTPGGTGGKPQRGQESGPRPVFGKITAIQNGVIEISGPDGQTMKVKYTDQTEFRKDREPAKASDFKVGDMVAVRGEPGTDHTITATMIGARTGGPRGGGMMMGGQGGTLGKDYIVGEVKSIDPPRMTVLRTDNVTQTLELNEETSLRKGRESITMADIQVGDHVISRGEVQKDVFVPKGVMVLGPEQWKRFEEFQAQMGGANKPAATDSAPPKPQE